MARNGSDATTRALYLDDELWVRAVRVARIRGEKERRRVSVSELARIGLADVVEKWETELDLEPIPTSSSSDSDS